MADRVEREIEEILARLDKELPKDGAPPPDRKPISITSARDVRAQREKFAKPARTRPALPLEPATLLLASGGVIIAGLVLSLTVWSPLIWLAFAGIAGFIGAFAWSLLRTKPAFDPRPSYHDGPGKVFWRDRYIDTRPEESSAADKIRRRFRR